jgi:uncharacterized membrane protein
MSGEHDPAYHGALTRFERLRRVVVRYELGELSHDEFTTLKQQVLLGYSTAGDTESARIGLLVAAYASPLAIDAALDAIRALSGTLRARIIDGAIVSRSEAETVRVRAIADLTNIAGRDAISVIGAISGLLFAAESLDVEQHKGVLASSFAALDWRPELRSELRAIGQVVTPGSSAILIVCWQSATNKLRKALNGYESCTHLAVRGDLSDVIVSILADARDGLLGGG